MPFSTLYEKEANADFQYNIKVFWLHRGKDSALSVVVKLPLPFKSGNARTVQMQYGSRWIILRSQSFLVLNSGDLDSGPCCEYRQQ